MSVFPKSLKPASKFGQNVLSLTKGTLLAKLISLLAVPFLARIYSPEEFGIFAFYSSVVAFFSVFATGRYEMAIVQTRRSADARQLVLGVILIAFVFCLGLFFLILAFREPISSMVAVSRESWILAIPLSVFLTVFCQSLNHWLISKADFERMGNNRILQAGVSAIVSFIAGIQDIGADGLILGQIVGFTFAILCLLRSLIDQFPKITRVRLFALARHYSNYPKYELIASGMNVLAQQLPNLLLVPLFGSFLAGQYSLIQRTFATPITLISSTVGSVFRQAAVIEQRKKGNFFHIFWNTLKKLILLGAPPALIILLFSNQIITLFFGSDWQLAAECAVILVPMFYLKFVVSPLTFSLYILRKNKLNTVGQLLFLVVTAISFLIGFWLKEFKLTLILFSLSSSLVYLAYLTLSWKIAKNKI